MSQVMEEAIKRWTARRKSALVLEIIQGKTTVAKASRQFDLTPSEIESWMDDAKRGMENAASSTSGSSRSCRKPTAKQTVPGSLLRRHTASRAHAPHTAPQSGISEPGTISRDTSEPGTVMFPQRHPR